MEIIAGVDEAGRGPLAGPVVAAAVILPPNHGIDGLKDSKKLTPKRREKLLTHIQEKALSIGVGIVNPGEIDRLNILRATQWAMRKALGQLNPAPDRALIDGFALPGKIVPNEGIIGGDDLVDEIKAASIVAKVTRDQLMQTMDLIFPHYGFGKHKGYGTPQHMKALARFKATPIHRKSFAPVKQHFPTLSWLRTQNRIGELGEQLTALRYFQRGYTLLAMNENCPPFGEIDLIVQKEEKTVFVEVKTFSKLQLGHPFQKLDPQKLARLERAVHYYCERESIETDLRLDVVAVYLGKGNPVLKRIKGIFLD